jgi:hypothetical protein
MLFPIKFTKAAINRDCFTNSINGLVFVMKSSFSVPQELSIGVLFVLTPTPTHSLLCLPPPSPLRLQANAEMALNFRIATVQFQCGHPDSSFSKIKAFAPETTKLPFQVSQHAVSLRK